MILEEARRRSDAGTVARGFHAPVRAAVLWRRVGARG